MILGALIGDFIGSVYEFSDRRGRDLPLITRESRPTDETFLIYATDRAIKSDGDYERSYIDIIRKYSDVGFGARLLDWSHSLDSLMTNSWGNGAATRAIPIASVESWDLDYALDEAERSAAVTHDTDDARLTSRAVVEALYRLRMGESTSSVIDSIEREYFGLDDNLDELGETFDTTDSIITVPVAIQVGLTSTSFIDAVRTCLALGGDVDSVMCIACSIASMRHPMEGVDKVRTMMNLKNMINYPELVEWQSSI